MRRKTPPLVIEVHVKPEPPASPPDPDAPLTEHEKKALDEGAFREGAHQAWFATGLEQTKSVFTLSAAGVGLSLTLLFALQSRPSRGDWGSFFVASPARSEQGTPTAR